MPGEGSRDEFNRDDLLMTLFDEARSLPENEQREFLTWAAGADLTLADDVWERLLWDRKMGSFLLEPILSPLNVAESAFVPGQILNERFEIVRLVAEGGMSIVYEALDRKQDQRIALKCPKVSFQRRLTPELKSALEVSHDNICRVQAIHTAVVDGHSIDFLTMEFLEGETLQTRVKRGAIPIPEFLVIARQICSGLDAAHKKDVVHGDLKSANIILSAWPDRSVRAVITDFGLARRLLSPASPSDVIDEPAGTPDFAAPEIWRGKAPSVASDIYSLGVILHEMLTGQLPLAAEAGSVFEKLPRRYRMSIVACLAEEPGKRPRNAVDVAEALSNFHLSGKTWLAGVLLAGVALAGGESVRQNFPGGKEPVRLAILPFDAPQTMQTIGRGIAGDVSNQLARLRSSNRQFISIPFQEVAQNGVTGTGTARSTLGATHALEVRLSETAKGVLARARIVELATGQPVSSLDGEYRMTEIGALPNALTGVVTAALHLHAFQKTEAVNAAAYGDYIRGLADLRNAPDSAELAIASLEAAGKKDTASALPQASLAEALALKFNQTEQPEWRERAEVALRQAEMRNPDAVETHLVSGLLHQTSGMQEQAVAEFLRALQIEPANLDALRRLAGAYAAMNLPDEATAIYEKAIAMDPGYYHPHMDLGTFLYFRSDYERAAKEFGEVVRTAPALAQGHFNRAAALMNLGRYDLCEAEYQEAIRLRGTRDDLIGMGALRAYQRRFPESTMFYEMARGKGPDSALLLSNLADSYRRTHRSRDAAITYKEALLLADGNLLGNPRNAYARALVGYLSVRCGDTARGEREIQQAIHLAPEDTKVRRWAVLSWAALNRWDRCLEALQQAPASLLSELSRQPDLSELQRDPRFLSLLARSGH